MKLGAAGKKCRLIMYGRPVLLAGLVASPVAGWADARQPEAPGTEARPEAVTKARPPTSSHPSAEDVPIVITGSRIPRRNLTAISPVTVVDRKEVKLQGTTNIEELLNRLPQVTPDEGVFLSGDATGTATVNLRDLGPPRTLVLINGRRMGPGDLSLPAPDLNAIPSSLIQRVEVLTGGASSVYGSDALAGVVNFILDKRLDGLRVDAQSSFFQHDNRNGSGLRDALIQKGISYPTGNTVDGGRQDITAAYGVGLLDNRVHATVYAGLRHVDPVTQDRRDYSACTARAKRNNRLFCGGSVMATYPGNFATFFGVYQIGPDRTFEPGLDEFNPAPTTYYQRSDRRYIAGGFADAELSAAFNPYVEIMWMNDRSVAQVASSGDFLATTQINCDNPLLSDQQKSLVCFDGNYVGQLPIFDNDQNLVEVLGSPTQFTDPVTGAQYLRGSLSIGRRNVEGEPRQDDYRHDNLRLVGGTKGDLGRGVTYDASYLYSRVQTSDKHLNDISFTRLTRALDVISDPVTGQPICRSVLTGEDPNCVPWDVFALGAVTSEAAAYLAANAEKHGSVKEQVANANATIDVDKWNLRSPLATEAPELNIGAEYRKDSIDYHPDELFRSGDLVGQTSPEQPFSGWTESKELFGEARVPLITNHVIERFALEGGYRQSWYSNSEHSFKTDTWKVGLDLIAIRGLRFRASHQRAVRAPNIQELFAPQFPQGLNDDPCAGLSPEATLEQCMHTGVTPAQFGNVVAIPELSSSFYNAIGGGNQELEPETATTDTAGIVLEPRFVPGLNATVDWFKIELKGAIQSIGAQAIMDTCIVTGDPLFCNRIHRGPNGTLWLSPSGYVDNRQANLGAIKLRGIDVSVNYRKTLGPAGSVSLEFLGSQMSKYIIDNGGLSTPFDCAGLYGGFCAVPLPHWRHTARATWESHDGFSLSFNWRYVGRVTSTAASGQFDTPVVPRNAHIEAQNYFDLTGVLQIERNFTLRLGVNNVLDREPPLVSNGPDQACFFGCNGNTYPQLYDPLGRYIFAGVTFNLKPY